MQALCKRVYAGATGRRVDGVFGRLVCGLLQLRASQDALLRLLFQREMRAMTIPVPARPKFQDPQIEMAHGAGGKASRRLVEDLIAPILLNCGEPLGDAAQLGIGGTWIAMTADSFVVSPLRFPGGSIGHLAVNGTVNDLAVSGAKPEALLVTFVIEAGLSSWELEAEI